MTISEALRVTETSILNELKRMPCTTQQLTCREVFRNTSEYGVIICLRKLIKDGKVIQGDDDTLRCAPTTNNA